MSRSASPAVQSLSRVEHVHPSAQVRHFDQLSEPAQEYVLAWADDEVVPKAVPDDLQSGDIVVFTDYLRVD
ncbi:hypothetical protein SAMN04487948_1047 [Halogranum amylolyticum]|uniref:DUF7979 domain-containing protein n=1 Tax=Halogranum amylolyticum TaxID=660520 RepID=A0A1H8RGN1_9EURY|nr:hypothetical protein [Halogranum amylolyticum]SEO65427.1 hypothetical protein SAMN04487948_1047 [Halogranum amylolyticum]